MEASRKVLSKGHLMYIPAAGSCRSRILRRALFLELDVFFFFFKKKKRILLFEAVLLIFISLSLMKSPYQVKKCTYIYIYIYVSIYANNSNFDKHLCRLIITSQSSIRILSHDSRR